MTTKKERETLEAIDALGADGWVGLVPGTKVYTTVRHVSRSGMTRDIDCYAMIDGEPRWISGLVARATGHTLHGDAVRVGGCGMDMGFHLVYVLSSTLFPDGFGCIGADCPSNDHSNGDRDYTPHGALESEIGTGVAHWHQSGGYALVQRWL